MITAWEGLAAALARLVDVDDPSHVRGHHGDNLAKGRWAFHCPHMFLSLKGVDVCQAYVHSFV